MKILPKIACICVLVCTACSLGQKIPDRTTNEAMLNFLPYLNQKIAGHIEENEINNLNYEIYKEIVYKECSPLPSCGKNASMMFDSYNVQPRFLGGMFSVMLCDKGAKKKILEDFSCNEQKVEIPSYQMQPDAECRFEINWKEQIVKDCPKIF
jgi:hypothetical protein